MVRTSLTQNQRSSFSRGFVFGINCIKIGFKYVVIEKSLQSNRTGYFEHKIDKNSFDETTFFIMKQAFLIA